LVALHIRECGLILGPTNKQLRHLVLLASLCAIGSTSGLEAQEHRTAAASQSHSKLAHARSALAAGDLGGAIQILSEHIQAHPHDTSARLLLAEAYVAGKQDSQAEEQYQSVLQLVPNNYMALAGLGEIYERAGNPEKAEPILARAAALSHGNAKVQTAWAAVLVRLHRYNDASHALAGVAQPSSTTERISFYRLKASIAAGLGNNDAAASEIEKALALSTDDAGLQMATIAAQAQAKHWKRAATLARPLFERTHDPRVGMILLESQFGTGEDIRTTLEALHALTLPADQELLMRQRLAELFIANERFPESADELKRAVELDPQRADLSFNLALVQFKAGRLAEALATAQSVQKFSDSAELEDLLGDIYEARNDSLAAVRSYERAIRLSPNEEKYRLSLALELMRHKSFEPARVILKQAEELHPNSWRVQLARGMLEYFAGSADDATRILLKAADIAPDPEPALIYLGEIRMDEAGTPDSAALNRLCEYSESHPNSGKLQFYCAGLMFRKDYALHDRSQSDSLIRRLSAAARVLPNDASPHCQLGKAYRWIEQWENALRESEICARMDPDSADAHYRLAQIYQHLGQQQRSEQEMKLYEVASARMADQNARREETIKTFLYSIQNDARAPK